MGAKIELYTLKSIGSRRQTEFIKGIGKRDEEFIIILDIDRVFSTDELIMVQQTDNFQESQKTAAAVAKKIGNHSRG